MSTEIFEVLLKKEKLHIIGDFARLAFVYNQEKLKPLAVLNCAEQVAEKFFGEGYSQYEPPSLEIKSLGLEDVEELHGKEIDNFDAVVKKEVFPEIEAVFFIDTSQKTIQEIDEFDFDKLFYDLGSSLSLVVQEYEPES